jgi:hypothetical protein
MTDELANTTLNQVTGWETHCVFKVYISPWCKLALGEVVAELTHIL